MAQPQKRIPPKSIIERVAKVADVDNLEAASDEIQFKVYKLTLIEIQRMLLEQDIPKATLLAMKQALNETKKGFYALRTRNSINTEDIKKVTLNLIDAEAYL